MPTTRSAPLAAFHPAVGRWFSGRFASPTRAQTLGWTSIANGQSTLIQAPTGSGKTLAAFLWTINRLMFGPAPERGERCRVVYISPLRALAADVERNLQAPLEGIAGIARQMDADPHVPAVAVRTGDTPSGDRTRFRRDPADILITTPESLYLVLTSNAREALRSVDTVIVDEIHALVPTKRGAHLALSLERLEALCMRPVQRIGLSATQRPLDEVARFLGGAVASVGERQAHAGARATGRASQQRDEPGRALDREFGEPAARPRYRPVAIVDAREKKQLELRIEMPAADAVRRGEPPTGGGSAPRGGAPSIWSAIHPRLVELIRTHRSTLVFVNNRRLAERLASAINEEAGDALARAHHGSIARPQRQSIEEDLKSGRLPALVATSSLELGIDMGAIDLVIQIGAPPSVASGLQRIGRGGHQAGAVSSGVIFPKFRGDLLACATAARALHTGEVEATRYPRNPLDVLAQQIAASVAMEPWGVDDLYRMVRQAAPFADLSRRVFEAVLDLLSGRFPSDDFAGLRPRVTWDRARHRITAREGTRRVAVVNGGTIPDRGLYGVFRAGAEAGSARVGELDEEMVFESRVGDAFVLGASTWRIEEITHDRVLVSASPGEAGRMPFWRGDQAGRPLEFGRAIGRLTRELAALPHDEAAARLMADHDLDREAADSLLGYLRDQAASSAVPDDRTIVVERSRDELGDWRVSVLSPFGGRVHAPWAMAVVAKTRDVLGLDVQTLWSDDGFVVRFPDLADPPDASLFQLRADEAARLAIGQLGSTALFAGKFREVAARALMLPRQHPGRRTPLWRQRRRAADLLAVASRFGSFPAVLETYRECIRDVFDIPALEDLLERVARRAVRLVAIETEKPSPFAASLLFGYVANFIYEGDSPLAERRAQALSVDQAQLRELLGDAELRDLLDARAVRDVEAELQHVEVGRRARHADGLHDLLLGVGDLGDAEIEQRTSSSDPGRLVRELVADGRALSVRVAGEDRYIAVEDASRYRDELHVDLPSTVPASLLDSVDDPRRDLVLRYARTHGPFTTEECAGRFGLAPESVHEVLARLAGEGKAVQGEFRPGGAGLEWCDAGVLRAIRRRSLAALRREVEPVDPAALARFVLEWQGVARPRQGTHALAEAVEQLQGAPIPASVIEDVLAARVHDYQPSELDLAVASGEVVWVGVEPLGERDGRIALYLASAFAALFRPGRAEALDARETRIVNHLLARGASFFRELHESAGGGYPGETVGAIWSLVWRGILTNDTFHPVRVFTRSVDEPRRRTGHHGTVEPGRRLAPPSTEGRWSLVASRARADLSETEWIAAATSQFLTRYGVLTREAVSAENVPGGFASVYPALKAMEERGRVRRGYFVAGLGATQFAWPAAVEALRAHRDRPEEPVSVALSAVDPANPYGGVVPWPETPRPDGAGDEGRGPTRSAGATVILVDGSLAAYLGRGGQLLVYLPDEEPDRSRVAAELAAKLMALARTGLRGQPGMLIGDINGIGAASHPLAPFLARAGFVATAMGYQARTA